jgi:hypothetical protein
MAATLKGATTAGSTAERGVREGFARAEEKAGVPNRGVLT